MHAATTTRIAALFAAVLTTTLVIGSQIGLADRYTEEANLVMAAHTTVTVATAASATQRPGRPG